MAKVSQMQGTPAHLETLKAKDGRRHPSYCSFHEGVGKRRICKNKKSSNYMLHCSSSKNCEHYLEQEE